MNKYTYKDFIKAIEESNLTIVQDYITIHSDAVAEAINLPGSGLLEAAMIAHDEKIVETLLSVPGVFLNEQLKHQCYSLSESQKMTEIIREIISRQEPSTHKKVSSQLFKEMISDYSAFNDTLMLHPELIHARDENGYTLLHHAAEMNSCNCSSATINAIFWTLLYSKQQIPLDIRDKNGNTPLHLAAKKCNDRLTYEVFPSLIMAAANRNFDFTLLDSNGMTVLHLAAQHTPHDFFGPMNNVQNMLSHGHGADINIDALSSSGETAFFITLFNRNLFAANSLVEAGANPFLYGKKGYDPMVLLDLIINTTADEMQPLWIRLKTRIEPLKPRFKNHAEIRKNARLIGQMSRGPSLFASLPRELRILIASISGDPQLHTQTEAHKIASEHLDRPKKNTRR